MLLGKLQALRAVDDADGDQTRCNPRRSNGRGDVDCALCLPLVPLRVEVLRLGAKRSAELTGTTLGVMCAFLRVPVGLRLVAGP